VTSLLFGCLLVVCLWWAGTSAFGAVAGFTAVAWFATSPLTPYFSRTAQPDITAAALATAALAVAIQRLGWIRAALAFALVTAAALVKVTAAVYLLPVLWFATFATKPSLARAAGHLALAGASVVGIFAWYRYAASLERLNGLTNFGVTRSPEQLWREWQMPQFWLRNFVQLPFDVWIFPAASVILLGRLAWRRRKTPWRVGALGATALAYIFLCGYSGAHHDYYGVVLLPALTLMAGWAGAELLSLLPTPRRAAVACAVVVAAAIGWQLARARGFWATRRLEWAELTAFSRQTLGTQGASRIVVFSDGSPQMFWFTGQIGRFGDPKGPSLERGDQFAVVDRLRLKQRASAVEAQLGAVGCERVFENSVGWICRPAAPP
jgi:4-amino-4-deoxy-L-arabinose transferase-like glycosyltransferase